MLFDPIQKLIATDSGMSSRATAFVILALCIGALVGLAQVVLKEAWLTVLDGYRAGRQLILSQPITSLGRADYLALPFLGPMNRDVEAEHVTITRRADGSYVVEDNHTRLGTRLNNQPLQGQAVLKNGDVIKFGTNFVRFNERQRRSAEEATAIRTTPTGVATAPPPPPTVRKRPAAATPPPIRSPLPTETPRVVPDTTPAKPATPGKITPPPPPRRPKET
jgi:hypothetical protein